jgi:hypothetical protein
VFYFFRFQTPQFVPRPSEGQKSAEAPTGAEELLPIFFSRGGSPPKEKDVRVR